MGQPARKLLRIYTDEAAYIGDRKVFEYVASLARDRKMAGLTVLEALIGFGASSHIHRRHVLESDRAVVIEIVDFEDALRAFVASLEDVPDIGLISLRSEEHTSELQSLMRISYAVFCLKKQKSTKQP